jgi:hypothetical protein
MYIIIIIIVIFVKLFAKETFFVSWHSILENKLIFKKNNNNMSNRNIIIELNSVKLRLIYIMSVDMKLGL